MTSNSCNIFPILLAARPFVARETLSFLVPSIARRASVPSDLNMNTAVESYSAPLIPTSAHPHPSLPTAITCTSTRAAAILPLTLAHAERPSHRQPIVCPLPVCRPLTLPQRAFPTVVDPPPRWWHSPHTQASVSTCSVPATSLAGPASPATTPKQPPLPHPPPNHAPPPALKQSSRLTASGPAPEHRYCSLFSGCAHAAFAAFRYHAQSRLTTATPVYYRLPLRTTPRQPPHPPFL